MPTLATRANVRESVHSRVVCLDLFASIGVLTSLGVSGSTFDICIGFTEARNIRMGARSIAF